MTPHVRFCRQRSVQGRTFPFAHSQAHCAKWAPYIIYRVCYGMPTLGGESIANRDRYDFKPVIAMPSVIRFWKKRKAMITGSVQTTEAAMVRAYSDV